MMTEWLHDKERFCVAKDGDFAGNTDTCYWGLPSIQASDPAFPPLGCAVLSSDRSSRQFPKCTFDNERDFIRGSGTSRGTSTVCVLVQY